MGTRFIAPILNDNLVEVCQFLSPLYLRLSARLKVAVEQSVHDAFFATSGAPVIICPNHSASDDALVAFELSHMTDQHFHFLTTRELFKWHPSLRSKWLQHLGCYSILRAAPDVQSYKTSCGLLRSASSKLLIFPEGEVSHQNGLLLPLEFGLIHLALEAAVEQNKTESERPIFVVPIGIFYRFDRDVTEELGRLLQKYELILDLTSGGLDTSMRIYRCFDRMLACQERDHRLPAELGESLEVRIQRLCAHLVHELCLRCSLDLADKLDVIDKLHLLKNKFTERRYCDNVEPSIEEREIYDSILRITTLIAVRDKSFAAPLSQEQVAELLQILNTELTQEPFVKADKTAFVAAGDPIDVTPLRRLYKSDKRKAVAAVADRLKESIQDVLADLMQRHPSISIVQ